MESDDSLATMDRLSASLDLLASPKARDAFSLKQESAATKELYGMNAWGQS